MHTLLEPCFPHYSLDISQQAHKNNLIFGDNFLYSCSCYVLLLVSIL